MVLLPPRGGVVRDAVCDEAMAFKLMLDVAVRREGNGTAKV